MNYDDALAWLDAHENREIGRLPVAGATEGLDLAPMLHLADVLGDPQRSFEVIHLTGTNGKGSVAQILTRLLVANGLSVGTYTSPHIDAVNERLAWNGEPIADEALATLVGELAAFEPLVGDQLSWFEWVTGAAYRWFAELAVDVAVVEVGLLGRFDATNVADAAVAVVTNVARDHTDGRPGWREEVAKEKAGIIKSGSRVVLGSVGEDLASIFASENEPEIRSDSDRVWLFDRDYGCELRSLALGGQVLTLFTPGARYEEVFLPLHGAHQAENATIAVAAAQAFFGRPLATEVVEDAFRAVKLPGRFEVVSRRPLVILDVAHNADGAARVAATLVEEFATMGSRLLVVGLLDGRDPLEYLTALGAAGADAIFVCRPETPRAMAMSRVASAAKTLGVHAERVELPVEALARALAVAGEEDLVLVTGSFYVVGPARSAWFRHHRRIQ